MNSSMDDFLNFEQLIETEKKAWALMRLDDNGNEFEVASFNSLETAEVARQSYQAKGHNQLYFLKKK